MPLILSSRGRRPRCPNLPEIPGCASRRPYHGIGRSTSNGFSSGSAVQVELAQSGVQIRPLALVLPGEMVTRPDITWSPTPTFRLPAVGSSSAFREIQFPSPRRPASGRGAPQPGMRRAPQDSAPPVLGPVGAAAGGPHTRRRAGGSGKPGAVAGSAFPRLRIGGLPLHQTRPKTQEPI